MVYQVGDCTVFEDESGYGSLAQWKANTPKGVMVGHSNNSRLLSFSPYNICESARHRFCMKYKMLDPEGGDICDKNYEMFVRMTNPEPLEEEEEYYYEEEEPPNLLIPAIALGGIALIIGFIIFKK